MDQNSSRYVEHLQGMVRIPTVSNPDSSKMDWAKFREFHEYLRTTWPLVHSKFTREVIGHAGLLYTWKGLDPTLEPLMLTAHQDVVPEGDASLWKHPPYSAVVEDGCIWGRGTTDSKCNIQAYMDALENLIAKGFTPKRGILMGFGYNEEVMGGDVPAAQLIADELKARGVSLGMLIDECGGLEEVDGHITATLYTCEKGYADYELSVTTEGGHSSTPPEHSGLGLVGYAAWELENHPMPFRLTEPVIAQLKALAPFFNDDRAKVYADPESHIAQLQELAQADKALNATLRTTAAVTMARGSAQANILPAVATILTNCRLLPGDTPESVQAYIESVIPQGVDVRLVKGSTPPPVSSIESEGYRAIATTLEELYPGITMIPSMLLGGTDARYYGDVSPSHSIYRFTGLLRNDSWGGAHMTDEHIACDILAPNVDFFARLIQNFCGA